MQMVLSTVLLSIDYWIEYYRAANKENKLDVFQWQCDKVHCNLTRENFILIPEIEYFEINVLTGSEKTTGSL